MTAQRVVLATGNPGKRRELAALLEPLGMDVVTQTELGVPEADETGLTFVENALLKARNAARHTGLAAVADDSGLEVDALGGAPGIYSSRYAGESGDGADAANNAKLLDALADVPPERRGAGFRAVVVFLRHADDPAPLIAEGVWRGRIATAPSGGGGFGYDPLFELPEHGCTSAELAPEEKNRLSHRARALQKLGEALRERAGS